MRNMTPYASARRSMSGGNLWLNANESPYSRDYMVDSQFLNRYPNFQSRTLNHAYADYAKVKFEQVMSHRGSDEGIELLIRAFCTPGQDAILTCPPTYGMYKISAQLNQNNTVEVPLIGDGQLDFDGIAQALNNNAIKIVFLCNPSNPLGNTLPRSAVEQVLELCKGKALVVSDEAYIEFAEQSGAQVSATDLLQNNPHLVVLRTLSKAFGLAGVRVGFTLANEALIQALVPVLAPYPLPAPSLQIAEQALTLDGQIELRQNVIEICAERDMLARALTGYGWVKRVYPSVTNFILCEVTNAEAVMQHCMQAGALIRNQSSQLGLANCVRISVGSPEENSELIRILDLYRAEEIPA
ncbi:histidinol-phosphate transaminase [Aliidiomarina celeris]|uniref:histidinol-phosphate transaminase n=1 Tax=Aliidiomarina celeris TaxID=2249428 RepID=UPI0022B7EF10|nr:histidinol-phosphate transaminase [Aliidiomarina celeris]